MREEINLKELERKAYTSYHEDGLLDIFLGYCIMAFAFTIFLNMAAITGIIPALAIILWPAAKKAITVPRVGYVKFDPRRGSRYLIIMGLLALCVLLGLLMGVFIWRMDAGMPHWMTLLFREYPKLTVGTCGTLMLAFVGYILGIRRFYGYAVLTFVLFFAGQLLPIGGAHLVVLLGLLLTLVGVIILARFLKKYPKRKEETSSR